MSKNLVAITIQRPPTTQVTRDIIKNDTPFLLMLVIKSGPAISPIGVKKSTKPIVDKVRKFQTKCPK